MFDGGFAPGSLAGLTIATWLVVMAGLARGWLPRSSVATTALITGAALVGFGILTAISISYTSDPGGAYADLVRICGYAGLFALVVLTAAPGDGWKWITGMGVGLAAISIAALGGRVLVGLPGDTELYTQLPAAQGLLSYPIGYWNGLAACMAAAITILAWLAVHLETRKARVRASTFLPLPILVIFLAASRGGAIAALAGLAALIWLAPDRRRQIGLPLAGIVGGLLLIVFASFLTDLRDATAGAEAERQGILALGAILIVCAGVSGFGERGVRLLRGVRIPRMTRRQAAISVGLVLAGSVLALGPGGLLDTIQDPTVSAQAGSGRSAELASATGRYQYWGAALGAFANNPVKGVGSSGFEIWWNINGDLSRSISQVHNLFIESMAELGVLGLALILAFLLLPLRLALRVARDSDPENSEHRSLAIVIVALLIGGLAIASLEWTWDIPASFAPIVIAAALGSSALVAGQARPRLARPGFTAGVATAVVGIVSVGAGLNLLSTEDHLKASKVASKEGRFDAAAREAREAVVLQPWAVEPRRRLALLEQDAGNLDAARLELDAAIERSPEDFSLWLLAADLQAQLGNTDAAQIARDRAEALNPRSPLFRG